MNGKVVNDKFGKLLDRLTSYRVKERPSSVIEILQELRIGRKISNTVSTSSVYSFKGEDLQAEHRVSIPSAMPNKQATKTTSSNNPASKQNVAKSLVELRSAKGIDYCELEKLLEQKKWIESDLLTIKLVLEVANRQRNGYLDTKDIIKFPSEDLRTIDQLWLYYSNERFGFSIQKDLWLKLNNNDLTYNYTAWKKFALQVGWYYTQKSRCKSHTCDEFINNIRNAQNAPLASLPRLVIGGIFLEWENAICLLLREDIDSLKKKKSAQNQSEQLKNYNDVSSNSSVNPTSTNTSNSLSNNKGCVIILLIILILLTIVTVNPAPDFIAVWVFQLSLYTSKKEK